MCATEYHVPRSFQQTREGGAFAFHSKGEETDLQGLTYLGMIVH